VSKFLFLTFLSKSQLRMGILNSSFDCRVSVMAYNTKVIHLGIIGHGTKLQGRASIVRLHGAEVAKLNIIDLSIELGAKIYAWHQALPLYLVELHFLLSFHPRLYDC